MQEPIVSLIAASPDEAVPTGVPLPDARLPSFDNDEVREWLSENRQSSVFVVAGEHVESSTTPAMAITVSPDEYDYVLEWLPR
ncbi:MAG TPA: hypothetical protein VGX23_34330 [Actinocrinis sp.]|nr:hypothetical protein [Actinocrinis sp.]